MKGVNIRATSEKLSSWSHFVHKTLKFNDFDVVVMVRTRTKCTKMRNAHAMHAKLLFFSHQICRFVAFHCHRRHQGLKVSTVAHIKLTSLVFQGPSKDFSKRGYSRR